MAVRGLTYFYRNYFYKPIKSYSILDDFKLERQTPANLCMAVLLRAWIEMSSSYNATGRTRTFSEVTRIHNLGVLHARLNQHGLIMRPTFISHIFVLVIIVNGIIVGHLLQQSDRTVKPGKDRCSFDYGYRHLMKNLLLMHVEGCIKSQWNRAFFCCLDLNC